ncbi:MAG: PD-(D/E)XK nuclease family protein [Cellvibrionaceae bacterium]|nr:PD-(D/E)XK nuclease family protein [Cellvibrionaceae bacterium]
MLPPLFRIETIAQACTENQLVLTANQRLRSKALQAWAHYLSERGKQSGVTPRLFSLSQWLESCWQQLQAQAYPSSQVTVASAEQERVLWEQVTANCGRMQPEVLARQAARGLQSLHLWQLPLTRLNDYIYTNHRDTQCQSSIELYRNWCDQFQALMAKHQLISREQSYGIISRAFSEKVLATEDNIWLLGFDDIPPLINTLLEKAAPVRTRVTNNDFQPTAIVQQRYRDTDTELTAAANWAKDILERQQSVRIGIIVPNLGQCRQTVEMALTKAFEGHSLLATTPRYSLPFNISAGIPLGNTPLIADTLALLNLQRNHWPVEDICQLLFSPFWGDSQRDLSQRTALASRLESLGKFTISGNDLRYWAQTLDATRPQQCGLYNYLHTFHTKLCRTKQLPSAWIDNFLTLLNCLDWPGERQPDSIEYQQTQAWYQLLETFASLDSTLGRISAAKAINELQSMAKRTPFQAEVTDSPIQVLGILEGVGLHFNHCWILGLDQQTWPPAPAPNPLLPLQLQRQYQLPHSTFERELAYAQSLTQDYCHCATQLVFSSAEQGQHDQVPQQASQLITHIPLAPNRVSPETEYTAARSEFDDYVLRLFHSQQLESVDCSQAPDYSNPGPAGKLLTGGASVIKAQAANPFDAFAIYRLGAHKPPPAVPGFSAIEQGNILHQALAVIWSRLKNQAGLLASTDEQLHHWVKDAVTAQVHLLQKRKTGHLQATLCQLEIDRQTQLIGDWLNHEKNRPVFQVVSLEQEQQLHWGNISIPIRIDRVDQLADDSLLVMDYKSGNSTLNAWKGERPQDPQLPLYLFAFEQAVSAIAFAQINIKELRFKGLHNGHQDINNISAIGDNRLGLPPQWEAAKDHWQGVLQQLLQEYIKGHCAVDYRSTDSINSQLLPLNRYLEGSLIVDWLTHQD